MSSFLVARGLSQQYVRNDALLDFGSTFENLCQARVPPEPFHGVQCRVAGAAEDLERLARHAFRHFGGEVFHHRSLNPVAAPGIDFGARSEERRVGKECRSRWWAYE